MNVAASSIHSDINPLTLLTEQRDALIISSRMVDGHCVRTIHAETNAIIQAALHGVSTKGSICYVTHLPCINCTKALINAGISRIVYSVAYRHDENAMNFLNAANIEVVQREFTPE